MQAATFIVPGWLADWLPGCLNWLPACKQGPYYTITDAFRAHAKHVVNAGGVLNCSDASEAGIPAAVAAAKSADTVVLTVGTDLSIAAEGTDANNLTLSPAQQSLVREVLAAAKGKVLVLLTTAVPLDISDLLSNDKVGAIVHLGVPVRQPERHFLFIYVSFVSYNHDHVAKTGSGQTNTAGGIHAES
jgi:hypothetical protein